MSDNVTYIILKDYPAYRVGTDGSVWSRFRKSVNSVCIIGNKWKRLKGRPNNKGYLRVTLYNEVTKTDVQISRLVLLNHGSGPPTPSHECGHRDGNSLNNDISNLKWLTTIENAKDKVRHGTYVCGEDVNFSKLNTKQVVEIKKLLKLGHAHRDIAKLYKVTRSNISYIASGKTWRNVKVG